MAFHWRADDGPMLNAGLVVLRISGDPVQYCSEIPPSGSAHGTGHCIHLKPILSNAHEHFFLIDETFFPEFHSGLIWIQTVFSNVNGERKRERLVHAHPFGKIKVHRQIDK